MIELGEHRVAVSVVGGSVLGRSLGVPPLAMREASGL